MSIWPKIRKSDKIINRDSPLLSIRPQGGGKGLRAIQLRGKPEGSPKPCHGGGGGGGGGWSAFRRGTDFTNRQTDSQEIQSSNLGILSKQRARPRSSPISPPFPRIRDYLGSLYPHRAAPRPAWIRADTIGLPEGGQAGLANQRRPIVTKADAALDRIGMPPGVFRAERRRQK
ncbi:predicted protein [Histoplasma capsulatum G186AR]|uniref:Uncharacterized protein n=1 Tax=Ajellomyces capsulatus (strain G186AR / H82 / ATCC MYA-2454 / RMSCC 2432) TaxID=447093 RepID=C0NG38_AJECG|nr:uncharacterized protein HCBG_01854 [Histoplasma capsulatum G186AR]EEH10209.1 predicted protein [Histoplasma capsulatum G186AR]